MSFYIQFESALGNNFQYRAIQSARVSFHHGSCSHMPRNKQFTRIMFAEKLAGQFKERFLKTLKNALNFRVELKPLFLKSFQGSRTQFQSKILVMLQTDVYVTADLYQFKRPDKPRIVGRYKINMLLLVREYALFVFIWSRQFKLYLRK